MNLAVGIRTKTAIWIIISTGTFREEQRQSIRISMRNLQNGSIQGLEVVKSVSLIDESDIQYFKVFCLYCMDYAPEINFFEKPDPRMAELGDAAVIIQNYNEFIERYGRALFAKYPYVTSMIDRVPFFYLRGE